MAGDAEYWCACQGELLTGCGASPREKCVVVNRAKRSWQSEECFNIRRGDVCLPC